MKRIVCILLCMFTICACVTGCSMDEDNYSYSSKKSFKQLYEQYASTFAQNHFYRPVEVYDTSIQFCIKYTSNSERNAANSAAISLFKDICDEYNADANSLLSEMSRTNALMGVQSETSGDLNFKWSYHPDNGLNIVVTK